MFEKLLDILDMIMSYFKPSREIARLKEKERYIEEKLKQAYAHRNNKLFVKLYGELKRLREKIRTLEKFR